VLVLAIESATDAAGVALADETGTVAQLTVSKGRRHAETITPSIKWCCDAAGVALGEVEAIVVDVGPGLFTGLRVGVGTAKALAYALGKPVIAVTSLEVLLRAASPASSGVPRAVAVLDARRGEVVSGEYEVGPDGPLTELLETPFDLASRLAARSSPAGSPDLLMVGDGAIRYEELLGMVPGARIGARWLSSPPVAVLAEIGLAHAIKAEFQDPLTLAPRYVRQADARINWTSRAARPVAGT
jgi:tRNA threonylcarbamoyladenosine biosynthesis protein TsaB